MDMALPNYAIIPAVWIVTGKFVGEKYRLMCLLAAHADPRKGGYCYPGQKRLAIMMKLARETINRMLREIRDEHPESLVVGRAGRRNVYWLPEVAAAIGEPKERTCDPQGSHKHTRADSNIPDSLSNAGVDSHARAEESVERERESGRNSDSKEKNDAGRKRSGTHSSFDYRADPGAAGPVVEIIPPDLLHPCDCIPVSDEADDGGGPRGAAYPLGYQFGGRDWDEL